MTISTAALFRALAVLIFVLVALVIAIANVLLSRHEGDSWTTALRHGFTAFGATVGVLGLLYGIAFVVA